MDINRLTEKGQQALRAAQSEATRLGHQQIDVEHLLPALLEQEGGLARSIFEKTGVDADLVRQRVETDRLQRRLRPHGARVGAGQALQNRVDTVGEGALFLDGHGRIAYRPSEKGSAPGPMLDSVSWPLG